MLIWAKILYSNEIIKSSIKIYKRSQGYKLHQIDKMIRPTPFIISKQNGIRVRTTSKRKLPFNDFQNKQKNKSLPKKSQVSKQNQNNLIASDQVLPDIKIQKVLTTKKLTLSCCRTKKSNLNSVQKIQINSISDFNQQQSQPIRLNQAQILRQSSTSNINISQIYECQGIKRNQRFPSIFKIHNEQLKIQDSTLDTKPLRYHKKSKCFMINKPLQHVKKVVEEIIFPNRLQIKNNNNLQQLTHKVNSTQLKHKANSTQYAVQTNHPFLNDQQYQIYLRYIRLQGMTLFTLQEKYKAMLQICRDSDNFYSRNKEIVENRQTQLDIENPKEHRIYSLREELNKIQKQNIKRIKQLDQINKLQTQKMKTFCLEVQSQGQKLLKFLKEKTKSNQLSETVQIKQNHKVQIIKPRKLKFQQSMLSLLSYCLQKVKTLYENSEVISSKLTKFQRCFKQWNDNIAQKDQITYNMVQQLQKFPQMSLRLFGVQKNSYFRDYVQKKTIQQRVTEYRYSKCQKCFQTGKKIDFLHFQNHNIKPILKGLNNLLKKPIQEKCYVKQKLYIKK